MDGLGTITSIGIGRYCATLRGNRRRCAGLLAAVLLIMPITVALPGSAAALGKRIGAEIGAQPRTGHPLFAPKTDYPVGKNPTAVVAADLACHGRADLAVTNGADGTVSVLLANPDGTFQPQRTYATGLGPSAIAAGDLTGNGRLDLVITNQGTGGHDDNTVSVLLGNGDGTFQPQRTFFTGANPDAVALGDFTGSGKLDLAVANVGDDTVSILRGNGDGTFQAPQTYPTGTNSNPASIAVGDFTGNGVQDLAVADDGIGKVSVFLGNGDGTFQPQRLYPAGVVPISVAAADLTGNGHLDLVLADEGDGQVHVLRGNGDGSFQPPRDYPAGSGSHSVAVADFTGDGSLDLAVANGANAVAVLRGNGDGTFQPAQSYPTGAGHYSTGDTVAVGDFKGNGRADLAVANALDGTVSVLLNTRRNEDCDPPGHADGSQATHVGHAGRRAHGSERI
ncbi:hypothetical protein ABIA32_000450 [Streptacidiphilus sp. MAP12-20]